MGGTAKMRLQRRSTASISSVKSLGKRLPYPTRCTSTVGTTRFQGTSITPVIAHSVSSSRISVSVIGSLRWLLSALGPVAGLAEGDGDDVADVDGVAVDVAGPVGVLRVEEVQLDVPAVTVQAAERAFLDVDGVQLALILQLRVEDPSGLDDVGGGEVQCPVAGGGAEVAQVVVDPVEEFPQRVPEPSLRFRCPFLRELLGDGDGPFDQLVDLPAVHPVQPPDLDDGDDLAGEQPDAAAGEAAGDGDPLDELCAVLVGDLTGQEIDEALVDVGPVRSGRLDRVNRVEL